MRRLFGVWEAVRKESDKLEKTKVRHNLVGARSLEGLGTLSRLGLKGLLLFMYLNLILW